ncbi:5-formyltetrahydrofolate cyclo-ligase [Niabella ginsenosidivorans]|uniref:5-formyltetrahydrofolate cyclo-ligase n=1 Tax=Niabella ginsenosidivorans TaxID=1176587 RepID=A0A1A9I2Y3_9BACT|nr:5-formyltetrahydrofolate cyclo-ligase [Niabella ginsenosidivorans]ANH81051.1 5-formyltetrahydrofolate cyclo-ligase [Niabella ginsenosidivorans]
MLKSEARKLYRQKRAAITPREQRIWDDLLLIQFQQLSLPPVRSVFSYAAIENRKEISPDAIIGYLEFSNPGLKIAYPVYDHSIAAMKAVWVNDATFFVVNPQGISEPENGIPAAPGELDIILVPLLCFDKAGYRVGYGKGVYDKFLKNVRPDALKIGLSYFEAVANIEDTNEFDVSLNYCITPHRIYEF